MSDTWRLRICLLVIGLEAVNFVVAKLSHQPTDATINTTFTTVIGIVITDGLINRKSKTSNGNKGDSS